MAYGGIRILIASGTCYTSIGVPAVYYVQFFPNRMERLDSKFYLELWRIFFLFFCILLHRFLLNVAQDCLVV